MRKGLVPTGAVFMGLVISLAILGIGYGLWSDTLRISGAVNTGAVNAAFSLHELDEGLRRGAPGGPTDNGANEDAEANGLDIAECYVRVLGGPANSDVAFDTSAFSADELASVKPGDRLLFLIKGGYPSFNCYVDFDVHNAGSIPVKVQQPVLGRFDPDALTVEFQNCYENGTELSPDEEALCTLHVHIERGADPNSWYRFGASICAYQWNADGPVRCIVPGEIEPVPAPGPVTPLTPINLSPSP